MDTHLAVANIHTQEAWEILQSQPASVLVDVRTLPEWMFVGIPDLTELGKQVLRLSWKIYPQMTVHPQFVETLSAQVPDKETPLVFICRSGGRSLDAAAAMLRAGYSHCYNVMEGFEGEPDEHGHRTRTGWKNAHLPWVQS